MKFCGVLLVLVGMFGFWAATKAFGDIGLACGVAGAAAFFAGFGIVAAAGRIEKLETAQSAQASAVQAVIRAQTGQPAG